MIGSGQVATARHASSITHSPIAGIRPASSATGMKTFGRDDAALRVVPADQRFEADQFLVLGVDQRLEVKWNCFEAIAARRSVSSRTRSSCSDCSSDEK